MGAGCLVFRMNAGKVAHNVRLSPAGTPDLLAITRHGIPYWIEVKGPGGKLRDSQVEMIDRLKERNQKVIVAHSATDVEWIR